MTRISATEAQRYTDRVNAALVLDRETIRMKHFIMVRQMFKEALTPEQRERRFNEIDMMQNTAIANLNEQVANSLASFYENTEIIED